MFRLSEGFIVIWSKKTCCALFICDAAIATLFFMFSAFAKPLQRTIAHPSAIARMASTVRNLDTLTDGAILEMISKKEVSIHKLESLLSDPVRALLIRRQFLFNDATQDKFANIPANHWDSEGFFSRVSVCKLLGCYFRDTTANRL